MQISLFGWLIVLLIRIAQSQSFQVLHASHSLASVNWSGINHNYLHSNPSNHQFQDKRIIKYGYPTRIRDRYLKLTAKMKSTLSPLSTFDRNIDLTTAIIGANAIIFMASSNNPQLLAKLVKQNYLISRGQIYRLLTATFVHASFPHLLMNMFSLYNIGYLAENIYGSMRYLLIYLCSGIAANYITYILKLSPVSLGASSSVYGVLGSLAMYYYLHQDTLGPSAQRGLRAIGRSLMMSFFQSFMFNPGSNSDHGAHVSGLLGGLVLSSLLQSEPRPTLNAGYNSQRYFIRMR